MQGFSVAQDKELGLVLRKVKMILKGLNLCGADEADDLAMEIMIKILKDRAGPQLSRSGWLYAVAKNHVNTVRRHQAIRNKVVCQSVFVDSDGAVRVNEDAEDDRPVCVKPAVISHASDLECDVLPSLEKNLERLPERLRRPLLLVAEGYSYAEVAALTNVNIGTVRSRVHTARKRLIDSMGEVHKMLV